MGHHGFTVAVGGECSACSSTLPPIPNLLQLLSLPHTNRHRARTLQLPTSLFLVLTHTATCTMNRKCVCSGRHFCLWCVQMRRVFLFFLNDTDCTVMTTLDMYWPYCYWSYMCYVTTRCSAACVPVIVRTLLTQYEWRHTNSALTEQPS